MHILLLDDELRPAEKIIKTLESMEYRVTAISSSQQAMDILEAAKKTKNLIDQIDLCFFDYRLDGDPKDGIDVAKEFVSKLQVPVIIYTRYSNEGEYAQNAIKAGIPHRFFIDKKIAENPVQLQAIIEDALVAFDFPKPSLFEYLNYASRKVGFYETRNGEMNYRFVEKDEIMFLVGNQGYTEVHLEGQNRQLLIPRNIGNIGGKINQVFFNIVRIDRSHYINLEQITRLQGATLYFSNGEHILLSDSGSSYLKRNNLIIDAQ